MHSSVRPCTPAPAPTRASSPAAQTSPGLDPGFGGPSEIGGALASRVAPAAAAGRALVRRPHRRDRCGRRIEAFDRDAVRSVRARTRVRRLLHDFSMVKKKWPRVEKFSPKTIAILMMSIAEQTS